MPNYDAPFIGKDALETLGNAILPDIAMGAYYDRQGFFQKFHVKVISGDEFQTTQYVLLTKGHTSRQWHAGARIENTAGRLVEKKLVTYLAWNRYRLNQSLFRELPKVIGDQVSYPNSEKNIHIALEEYNQDVFDNVIYGDVENDKLPEKSGLRHLGLFDGWMKFIEAGVNAGEIKPIQLTNTIADPTSVDDVQAWLAFKEFRSKLDPALRGAKTLMVICTPATAEAIATAYANSKGNHPGKELGVNNLGNYTIPEMPNVEIAFDDAWGQGTKLIATVPENLRYGIDTRNPENSFSIKEETSVDNDDYVMQPKTAQGTCILRLDPKHFAVSDGTLTPLDLQADYYYSNVSLFPNNGDWGKVLLNEAEIEDPCKDYSVGETLSIKAVAKDGYAFETWSDGDTNAERNIVVKAAPVALTAIFKKA